MHCPVLFPVRGRSRRNVGGTPPGTRTVEKRRRECEDFAPRNGGTRASGERGAKRVGRRAPERTKSDGGTVEAGLRRAALKSHGYVNLLTIKDGDYFS